MDNYKLSSAFFCAAVHPLTDSKGLFLVNYHYPLFNLHNRTPING